MPTRSGCRRLARQTIDGLSRVNFFRIATLRSAKASAKTAVRTPTGALIIPMLSGAQGCLQDNRVKRIVNENSIIIFLLSMLF